MIIAPIVASLGVPVIKMSGRGLGYTGGTIDKLESIKGFNIALDDNQVFMLADATVNPTDPSITHTTLVYRMYKADIESGTVTKAGWSDGE